MKWVALLMFGTVGLGALIGGLWWGAKRYQITSTGLTAAGKVVAQKEIESSDSGLDSSGRMRTTSYRRHTTGYYPIVEFETDGEETIRIQGSSGGQDKALLETGTEVTVIYDPSDPSKAVIAEFQQAWLGPVVLTVAGFIFLVFGIAGFKLIEDSDRSFQDADEMIRQGRLEMEQAFERQERAKGTDRWRQD